jgi:nitrogenase subunit NifH
VQTCERAGYSVIEKEPDSEIAQVYRKLARSIMERDTTCDPTPLTDKRLRELTE